MGVTKAKQIERARNMWFNGAKMKEAADCNDINVQTLHREIYKYECFHPCCTDLHPCRAAKRVTNGRMICTVLQDTFFDYGERCPFYKTDAMYQDEFERTNKMTYSEMVALGYVE